MPPLTTSKPHLNGLRRLALLLVVICLPLQGLAVVVERLQGVLHTHQPVAASVSNSIELDLSVLHHDLPSKRRVPVHLTHGHQQAVVDQRPQAAADHPEHATAEQHHHAEADRHDHAVTDTSVVISAQTQPAEVTAAATSIGKRLLADVDGAFRMVELTPAPGLALAAPLHEPGSISSIDPRRRDRPPRPA